SKICSLIYQLGSPVFFITITPCDMDGSLCQLAIKGINSYGVLSMGTTPHSQFNRAMGIAHNPAVAASVFHHTMVWFCNIILHIGKGPGLFGNCTGWYGMVEAQGHSMLHCHMFIWVEGNPTLHMLRKMMLTNSNFQERMIQWLKHIIHTELPRQTEVVPEPNGPVLPPKLNVNAVDPWTMAIPDLSQCTEWSTMFCDCVHTLVEWNNWHVH
ncbi:hypothetical protein DACRYDRAFT_51561, partial [Dacryopinax primogenitus]